MKISYKRLKEFIDIQNTPEEISLILTNIGLEVESLNRVETVRGGLEGLIIGCVTDCNQHQNADRLRITKVDVGTGEDLQVVCGASNVATGQKVIVAPVGSTVYPVAGEPFKINKSKIRGEVSEGMICAEDEIGLGASHDGIMVLGEDASVGVSAKEYFKINDDYVYEIGLTPNRADAASHLGVARDLAAFLKVEVKMPDISDFTTESTDLTIRVKVENAKACPRYSSVTIVGVEVKESPEWLKRHLNVIGIRPINNIVDVTNYVLHELGQPLHAFDADKITGNQVMVKNCVEGTSFITLDGAERKLSSEDLMICNVEKPMCIAGVFGGAESGVGQATKNVFLESAYFNPVSIRKTSKRHALKTDASFRFERGTDPEITVKALKRAALLIKEVAGGTVSSEIGDIYPSHFLPSDVTINYGNVTRLIGKEIPPKRIREILAGLGIEITRETDLGLQLRVPAFKVDVTREVDVIEEILRIYGYDNVEIPTQIKASLNYFAKPDKETVQNQISDLLSANGFFEILTNSLTQAAYSGDACKLVKILNPLSSDLNSMRQSLLFSGLEAISYNLNRKNSDLKLYEFGKIYFTTDAGFKEQQRLSIFITGTFSKERRNKTPSNSTFYNLKSVVESIFERLGISDYAVEDCVGCDLAFGLVFKKGDKPLVVFGSVDKAVLKKSDIEKEVFYADFDWDLIFKAIRKNKIVYKEVSKFPAVRRDLSLFIDGAVSFNQLKQIALKTEKSLLKEVNVFDVYEGDKLPKGKKSYALSFILQDEEKTLTDKQIDSVMQRIIYNLEKEGAEVRK